VAEGSSWASRKQGWALVIPDLDLDTSTPMGEAMANMAGVFAQFERRMIGQRTREGLAVKCAQGIRLGRPRSVTDATSKQIRKRRKADQSCYEHLWMRLARQDSATLFKAGVIA
jgi:DNA invertase Pin-like site-specific DNA recombinase